LDEIRIGSKIIGEARPVYIIAEIGMNHNGEYGLAEKLIRAAADCGVDAVKFQTYKTEFFYSRKFPNFEERQKSELPFDWHKPLKVVADEAGVEFISTPFDTESADFLDRLGVACFKVASSDLNNYPFLEYISRKKKPVLLSTGFSTLDEVRKAVSSVLKYHKQLVLLHCVSTYPAAIEHTTDVSIVPVAATAVGACIIEKHFTLDRNLPGYDHRMSVTPAGLKKMVRNVRDTEKALGSGTKQPTEAEMKRISGARRSLYWKGSYPAGTVITPEMLLILRPGGGLEPEMLDKICGHRLLEAVAADTLIGKSQIDWHD